MLIGSLFEPRERFWKRSIWSGGPAAVPGAAATPPPCGFLAATIVGHTTSASAPARTSARSQRPRTRRLPTLQHRLHVPLEMKALRLHLDRHVLTVDGETVADDRDRCRRHDDVGGTVVDGSIGLHHVILEMDLDRALQLGTVHVP